MTRLAILLVGLAVIGCGDGKSGPTRYAVSGAVTYNNAPLKAGAIAFEPDAAAGNKGPAASGTIVDGKYSIPATAGVIGGPHVIRVSPPTAVSGSDPATVVNFPPFEMKADLPKKAAQQDVQVPLSPANTSAN